MMSVYLEVGDRDVDRMPSILLARRLRECERSLVDQDKLVGVGGASAMSSSRCCHQDVEYSCHAE